MSGKVGRNPKREFGFESDGMPEGADFFGNVFSPFVHSAARRQIAGLNVREEFRFRLVRDAGRDLE